MSTPKPCTLLLILDGWGYSDSTEYNAIHSARTPVWDRLWANAPHTLVQTSGLAVGLPEGQMGNSEVGHMTLGAGRVVYQNYTRIDKAIADGEFARNPVYTDAIDKAAMNGKAVHIMGLLSTGGVHSHENHLFAAAELAVARGASAVYLHAFLDGRDTPPRSAEASLRNADAVFERLGVGRVASICGRYYAMDRDKRWDRVEQAYNLLVDGVAARRATSAVEGLLAAYNNDQNDEFVAPTAICPTGTEPARIEDGDAVLFMNFRPDRARQLAYAMTKSTFNGFARQRVPAMGAMVMTTEYADDLDIPCAFPAQPLVNSFGEYLQGQDKTQLRIAETEKYAHVTFFFSGGQEALYAGETRILVDSPKVATYDLQPEMSAPEVTDKLCAAIRSGEFDAIICNYANGDMVGHSGIFDAAVKAVEAVDSCLGRIVEALDEVGGQCLITADHGNVEQMVDAETGQPLTSHTTGPVPLVYVGNHSLTLKPNGSLADIAPTLLELMDLPQPGEMTGASLVA